jgi:hypothetical protein
MSDNPELDRIVAAYLERALWCATDEEGEPLDRSFTVDDFSEAARSSVEADCEGFIDGITGDDYCAYVALESVDRFGHDFFLTRNRHGVGFWDCSFNPAHVGLLERLTNDAHTYGESDVYVSDTGELEVS